MKAKKKLFCVAEILIAKFGEKSNEENDGRRFFLLCVPPTLFLLLRVNLAVCSPMYVCVIANRQP
jgi:hypothetical protein